MAQANAASPQFLGSFRDWNLNSFEDDNGKVCYITSEPTKEDGNYTRRGTPVAYVTKLPIDPPNVQVSAQPSSVFCPRSRHRQSPGRRPS